VVLFGRHAAAQQFHDLLHVIRYSSRTTAEFVEMMFARNAEAYDNRSNHFRRHFSSPAGAIGRRHMNPVVFTAPVEDDDRNNLSRRVYSELLARFAHSLRDLSRQPAASAFEALDLGASLRTDVE
jgi:hypothetical protein